MRIASFLPSGTEIVYALGAGEMIVAVSHECDYPPEAQRKPIVSRARLDQAQLDSAAIDALVSRALAAGESLYTIDHEVLRQANPDLLITQKLCDVCAVTGDDLAKALRAVKIAPKILSLTPRDLAGIFDNIRDVGEAIGLRERAARLIADLRARVDRVAATASAAGSRPTVSGARRCQVFRPGTGHEESPQAPAPRKVLCLEWLDPLYTSGHWMPELVELAGGVDPLGRKGKYSTRVRWDDVMAAAPEILVVTACGFDVARTMQELPKLTQQPGWNDLPAVQHDRVYVAYGSAYFSRPGPRVVDGLEILAHVIHPAEFPAQYPGHVLQHVSQAKGVRPMGLTPLQRSARNVAS